MYNTYYGTREACWVGYMYTLWYPGGMLGRRCTPYGTREACLVGMREVYIPCYTSLGGMRERCIYSGICLPGGYERCTYPGICLPGVCRRGTYPGICLSYVLPGTPTSSVPPGTLSPLSAVRDDKTLGSYPRLIRDMRRIVGFLLLEV